MTPFIRTEWSDDSDCGQDSHTDRPSCHSGDQYEMVRVLGNGLSKKVMATFVLVLALTAILSLTICVPFADANPPTNGKCGENLTWTVSDDTLTIEGFGAMYDYSENNNRWGGRIYFTSVSISDELTHIGNYAFYNCEGFDSVTIPDSVKTIGEGAFNRCGSITSVTIPNSVKTIGNSAFEDCPFLSSINIPDSVTSIGSKAFYDCGNINSIRIPYSVSSIGSNAFGDLSFYDQNGQNLDNTADDLRGHVFIKSNGKLQAVAPGVQTVSFNANGGNSDSSELTTGNDGRLSSALPNAH